MNDKEKRPVGGGFLQKTQRNENLWNYHKRHPEMSHAKLGRVFKISRVRVTQLLKENNLPWEDGDN